MYEIEVEDSLSLRLALHDPIKGLESTLPGPPDRIPYQRDGDATVLVGVVQQKEFFQIVMTTYQQAGGTRASLVSLSRELATMV